MAAISMTGSNVYAGAELWGHVRADGIVFTVEMTKVGTVRRIESTGPRGGKRTVWEARVWRHLSEFVGDFSTRTGAVRALVAALEGERAVESAAVADHVCGWGECMCHTDTVDTVPAPDTCTVCVSVDGDCLCGPVDAIPVPDTCGTCLGVDGDCVCEPPVRATVTDYRAGDYVEVDIAGDVQVFTWSDDRGVRRNYSVVIDGHADYGDFMADPAGWVRRYYRDEEVDVVNVSPCPCGGSYVDGVCRSCDSCSGCAECAPKHSYAGSVSHEVLSVDVQRHAAYSDAPASIVARVRVRYSFPDAPDRVHGFLFSSNDGEPGMVRMTSTMPRGTGLVSVDDPARFGSFTVDPVAWVHSFYA